MTAPLAPGFRPGEPASASKLNELSQLAEQSLRVRGGANAYSGGAGQSFAVPESESFWAQITADFTSPASHGFIEVQESDDDDGAFVEKTDGVAGDSVYTPLYEINGLQIAEGSIVRAWKGYGDYYLCSHPTASSVYSNDIIFNTDTTWNSTNVTWDVDEFTFTGTTVDIDVTNVNVNSGTWLFGTNVNVTYNGPLTVCGWMFWCYDDLAFNSSTMNNVSVDVGTAADRAIVYRVSLTTNTNLTGLVGGGDGHVVALTNTSTTYSLTLKHDSASSTAANRFLLPNAADVVLPVNGSAVFWYDATSSRWRVLADTIVGTGISGSGTTGYLAEWTSSSTLGDSPINDHDGVVEIHSRGLIGTVTNKNFASVTGNHDYALPDTLILTVECSGTPGTALEITGFAGGSLGRILFLWNKHTSDLILKDYVLGAASASGNQFGLNGDLTVASGFGVTLFYNASGFWVPI